MITCDEFKEKLKKHPMEYTTAELATIARHYKDCAECRKMVKIKAEAKAKTMTRKEVIKQDAEGVAAGIRCLKDPEALEVIYGD